MKVYWLTWFFVGFGLAEIFAMITGRETLSQTWNWLVRDYLPVWLAVGASAATAAALLWLLVPHWVFSHADREGFDLFEVLTIVVGALLGVVAATSSRRGEGDTAHGDDKRNDGQEGL